MSNRSFPIVDVEAVVGMNALIYGVMAVLGILYVARRKARLKNEKE